MKFVGIILRIKSFWTAFALSLIFVSVFSDNINVCPISHTPKTVEIPAFRPAEKNIPEVSSEDYTVYSAVLGQIHSPEEFVVGELTVDSERKSILSTTHSGFSNATLIDYQLRNQEVRKLRNEFRLPFQVSLLSREEEDLLFPKGEGGWDGFYQAYPKARGIIYFSNVGFNKNKDEALVRVKTQSKFRSQENNFFVLKKVEGVWLVEDVSRGIGVVE